MSEVSHCRVMGCFLLHLHFMLLLDSLTVLSTAITSLSHVIIYTQREWLMPFQSVGVQHRKWQRDVWSDLHVEVWAAGVWRWNTHRVPVVVRTLMWFQAGPLEALFEFWGWFLCLMWRCDVKPRQCWLRREHLCQKPHGVTAASHSVTGRQLHTGCRLKSKCLLFKVFVWFLVVSLSITDTSFAGQQTARKHPCSD